MSERPYLSIGEVLGLLLEEFPDVTISKIRFLESQGLIDPERTPSGYRKFYDGDVERLRVILREQRENFLPLRVIRDRLEKGEIDDTGGHTPPRGIRNVILLEPDTDETGELMVSSDDTGAHRPPPRSPVAADPGGQSACPACPACRTVPDPAASHDNYLAGEVCSMAGITPKQLAELESYGLVTRQGRGLERALLGGRPRHRQGCRRVPGKRCRGPSPPGLAAGGRTRGIPVRATGAAPASASATPRAGSRPRSP